jgi:spermidine/putrescine-binding protein
MAKQAGIEIAYSAKSARADESIQKMVVGDGSKLYDALSDNGGGMEDALASQGAVVPLDTSRIPNWKNVLPIYNEGGSAADTIRHKGKVYAIPYILIALKKKGQFRTFWDGFQNGVGLLASEEVLVSSCWEPIQIIAARKSKQDIRYGTMKEGHQAWNNIFMLSKGGLARGQDQAFYDLMNVYMSTWFGARTLKGLGFTPQMQGVNEYVEANPGDFDDAAKAEIAERLKNKKARNSVKGNSWQNVFPTHMRDYQDWWAKVQAA